MDPFLPSPVFVVLFFTKCFSCLSLPWIRPCAVILPRSLLILILPFAEFWIFSSLLQSDYLLLD